MTATSQLMTVSRNGQVSIPAEVRARWNTRRVIVVDLGDRVVMRPLPDRPSTIWRASTRSRVPAANGLGVTPDEMTPRGPSALTVLDAYAVIAYLRAELRPAKCGASSARAPPC